jgi:hypothetical protein
MDATTYHCYCPHQDADSKHDSRPFDPQVDGEGPPVKCQNGQLDKGHGERVADFRDEQRQRRGVHAIGFCCPHVLPESTTDTCRFEIVSNNKLSMAGRMDEPYPATLRTCARAGGCLESEPGAF